MNDILKNAIQQDFMLLKTLLNDNFKLSLYLKIDFADSLTIIDNLKACKESSDIELKKNYLHQIMFILEDALYRTITPGKLNEAIKITDSLVFLTCVNIKTISQKAAKTAAGTTENNTAPTFDIKDIVKELPLIAKEVPESIMYVRVITNLLKKYKEISINMNEKALLNTGKSGEYISETYKQELTNVLDSIKKQYGNMILGIPVLKERFDDKNKNSNIEDEKEDIFFNTDFKHLKANLSHQLSEYSRIRSSLLYIKREGFDILSTIKELYDEQKHFMEITTEEERAIFNVMSDNNISVKDFNIFLFRIADELIKYIETKFITPYTR